MSYQYTPGSLKRLEMPNLCKKLGFKTRDDERITGINFCFNRFSNAVCIWFGLKGTLQTWSMVCACAKDDKKQQYTEIWSACRAAP